MIMNQYLLRDWNVCIHLNIQPTTDELETNKQALEPYIRPWISIFMLNYEWNESLINCFQRNKITTQEKSIMLSCNNNMIISWNECVKLSFQRRIKKEINITKCVVSKLWETLLMFRLEE